PLPHPAQFEISIDGVPRTYRDQKDLALLAAQILIEGDDYRAQIIATKSISKIGINTMAKIRAMPPPIPYDFSSSTSRGRG
ncbi:MAG: hypothetical protein WAO16_06430, partial [Pseudolabrys sp.]